MTTFYTLPRELRDQVYELCLLESEPIDPFTSNDPPYHISTGLFRASKVVSAESLLLFYSRNTLDFSYTPAEQLESFFASIGHNVVHITRIEFAFPYIESLEPTTLALDDEFCGALEIIKNSCLNLGTVTTSVFSTHDAEMRLESMDNLKLATNALNLVDGQIRSISSISRLIVRLFEDNDGGFIRKEMKNLGWEIATQPMEEYGIDEDPYEIDISDGDWDEHQDDYLSGEEYDIDNDSDFWRRAQD